MMEALALGLLGVIWALCALYAAKDKRMPCTGIEERNYPPSDPELEAQIQAIVWRKNAAETKSPEWRFCVRQLQGLRYSREEAGGIIESLDPYWGFDAVPLPDTAPSAPAAPQVIPMSRPGSRS